MLAAVVLRLENFSRKSCCRQKQIDYCLMFSRLQIVQLFSCSYIIPTPAYLCMGVDTVITFDINSDILQVYVYNMLKPCLKVALVSLAKSATITFPACVALIGPESQV